MAPETLNPLPTPPPEKQPTPRRRRFEHVEPHGTDSLREANRSNEEPQPRDYESEEKCVAECLILLTRSGGGPCLSSSPSIANPAAIATSSPSIDARKEENKFTATATIADAKKQQEISYSANAATIAAASPPTGAEKEENQPTATASATVDVMKQQKSSHSTNPATGASTKENQPTAANISPPTASATVDAKKQQEYYPATPPPSAQNSSYKCSVCGETFRSHQALGGHKTRHRAKPPTITASGDSPCNATPIVSNSISALNPSGIPHECSICHKVFPTGQALGGHKRKHCDGIIGSSAAKSYTTSSNSSRGMKNRVTCDDDGATSQVNIDRLFD